MDLIKWDEISNQIATCNDINILIKLDNRLEAILKGYEIGKQELAQEIIVKCEKEKNPNVIISIMDKKYLK